MIMKKKRIHSIPVLFLIFFCACSEKQQDQVVIFSPAETPLTSIVSANGGTFEKNDTALFVRTTGSPEYPGIRINGSWDFSGCGTIKIGIENGDGKGALPLRISLENPNADIKRWEDGIYVCKITVPAGVSEEFTFKIPPKIPYPEVVGKLRGIRYTPYSGVAYTPYFRAPAGNKTYPRSFLDPSDVVAISVCSALPNTEREWSVKHILADGGKPGLLQPWMNMPPAKFFPFIDVYGQFKHKEWPGKISSDENLKQALANELSDIEKHPGPAGRNKYGGWKNGPKQKATGHFYVKKINGKWWMVDPEGCLFWSHGAVRVTPSSAVTPLDDVVADGYHDASMSDSDIVFNGRRFYFENLPGEGTPYAEFYSTHDQLLKPYYEARGIKNTYDFSSSNLMRKYGEGWRKKFAEMVHKRFKSWGMNSIANSSDKEICLQDKTPYCDRVELKSPEIAGCPDKGWWKVKDPFHPEFRASLRNQLMMHKTELDDPWCFGFFVDNENYWGGITSLAEWTLQSPAEQPAKKEMVTRLKRKYKNIEALNSVWKSGYSGWDDLLRSQEKPPSGSETDCQEFTNVLIDAYFKNIREVFKEVSPDKLYMGCRFAGYHENLLRISAKYCDVMSFNIYRFTLDQFRLPEGIDLPVIIGEFQFGALDRGSICPGMIPVENQQEYGNAYYNYLLLALHHPNVVGTHWFQYSDLATTGRFDGANCQTGLTDVCDTPYPEIIGKVREIGYKLYETRKKNE